MAFELPAFTIQSIDMSLVVLIRFQFVFGIVFFFLSSCSDSEETKPTRELAEGTIVAKIGGVETTFPVDAHAWVDTLKSVTGVPEKLKLIITAKNGKGLSKDFMLWFIVDTVRPIEKGVYPDLNIGRYHGIEYNDLWEGELYNYGSNRFIDKIYITEASVTRIDTVVEGVFDGTIAVFPSEMGDAKIPYTLEIKSGMFKVRMDE
jgi:hypothetical protein